MSKWASEGKDWVQDVTMHPPKKDEVNIAPLKMTRQPTKHLLRKQTQEQRSAWASDGQGMVYQDHPVEKKEGDWAIHIFPEHNKEPMPGPNTELESSWRNWRTKWTLTAVMHQEFVDSAMAAVEQLDMANVLHTCSWPACCSQKM